jgi:hypothetical protein
VAFLSGRGALIAALVVALRCPFADGAIGPLTEPQAKASLLFNLPAFVEWPPNVLGPGDRLNICVAGDLDVLAALRPYEGRQLDGRTVTSRAVEDSEDPAGCHVLFLSASREHIAMLHRLADRPVITVGDAPEFAREGGALRVFFEESRLRFEINTTTVARTRLRVSSKMLGLARLVRSDDEP